MKRVWQTPVGVFAGLLIAAMSAMPQATISARPGVINYIEGQVYLDGQVLSQKSLGRETALYSNQSLSTQNGKAEVLLTPGVFLRVGEQSEVRMISPSLTHTQVEVTKGEAIVEVGQLFKDNDIQIIEHGSSITLLKPGIYRFAADVPPTVSVMDGKAQVSLNDRNVELKKGRQVVLADNLAVEKFDPKKDKQDDLYAWSDLRSEYNAGASYASAKTVAQSGYGSSFWGGVDAYNGLYSPGWYWNSAWNSWSWLPGSGYAFSPFGWGFYSPGYVVYAPVIYRPVHGGGTVPVPCRPGRPPHGSAVAGAGGPRGTIPSSAVNRTVPVNSFRPNSTAPLMHSMPARSFQPGPGANRSFSAPAGHPSAAHPSFSGGAPRSFGGSGGGGASHGGGGASHK